jgi:hypothetical protein
VNIDPARIQYLLVALEIHPNEEDMEQVFPLATSVRRRHSVVLTLPELQVVKIALMPRRLFEIPMASMKNILPTLNVQSAMRNH